MIRLIVILAWVLGGVLLAAYVNHQQMKEEIPFGSLPSGIMSVDGIRKTVYVVCITFFPFLILRILWDWLWESLGGTSIQ